MRNLEKNILYPVCETQTRRRDCRPVKIDFIFSTFSDIPKGDIDAAIDRLKTLEWLREEKNRTRLAITDAGRSEIRSAVPPWIQDSCRKFSTCPTG